MKCPKCGYHSFDYLDSCKKCDQDLTAHKEKFNLRGFVSPGQLVVAESESVIEQNYEEEEVAANGPIDFGFDFLDEEPAVGEPDNKVSLSADDQAVNIDQPFGADSETIPADTHSEEDGDDSNDKPGKGPDFAF